MITREQDTIIMFTNSKLANLCSPMRINPNKISYEKFGSNGKFN